MNRHGKRSSGIDLTVSALKRPPLYIGDIRRSAAAGAFGPGAIADFRTKRGATVSAVLPSADEWSDWPQREPVFDERLQKKLNVHQFLLAPIVRDKRTEQRLALRAVRFPQWLMCPKCHQIKPARGWAPVEGDAARFCSGCSSGPHWVYAVPVRFILACANGHLADFRWESWVAHTDACPARTNARLFLDTLGAGLGGLRVRCGSCSASRSMQDAFNADIMSHWKCDGSRPWIGGAAEPCAEPVRVVQRGASNLYFPIVSSSLLIPPWDSDIETRLQACWSLLLDAEPSDRRKYLGTWIDRGMVILPSKVTANDFIDLVMAYLATREAPADEDLRAEEWEMLRVSSPRPSPDFEVRREKISPSLAGLCAGVSRVVRLRELRALRGFTRIKPPPSSEDPGKTIVSPVFRTPQRWLPATEVRGEGIFVDLDAAALERWEALPTVVNRAHKISEMWRSAYGERFGKDEEPERELTARFLLAHALSHALMRQLALDCGYSSASLRERVYAGPFGAGVLIYTGASDADGTLGGLERQGIPERISATLTAAIQSCAWCSSDPLCVSGVMMATDACSLASCHSCLLASETSCEEFNRFLDRALIVGTNDNPEVGFFRSLVQ